MVQRIVLRGCDDHTLMEMEVDEKELELLRRLAKLSEKTSIYQCMPTLELQEEEWHEFSRDEVGKEKA